VPAKKLSPDFDSVKTLDDVKSFDLQRIAHFFKHYKDLEKDKWVDVKRWGDAEEAASLINRALG